MTWWKILLIAVSAISVPVAILSVWFIYQFTKVMDEAFGYSKKYRWWR